MKTHTPILFVLSLFAALPAFASSSAVNCKDDARYPNIEHKDLAPLVEAKGAYIIDVNSNDSYAKTHIPGAVHFTSAKELKLPENKDALIVAYCGGTACTAWKKAAQAACEKGYTNIKHYKAGIAGWKDATATAPKKS